MCVCFTLRKLNVKHTGTSYIRVSTVMRCHLKTNPDLIFLQQAKMTRGWIFRYTINKDSRWTINEIAEATCFSEC